LLLATNKYRTCEIAYDSAYNDVVNDNIIIYIRVSDGDDGSEPVYNYVDSVLRNRYGFRVEISNLMGADITKMCYMKCIRTHFDSAYNDYLLVSNLVRSFNQKRDE
jgi:hypothetical protein